MIASLRRRHRWFIPFVVLAAAAALGWALSNPRGPAPAMVWPTELTPR